MPRRPWTAEELELLRQSSYALVELLRTGRYTFREALDAQLDNEDDNDLQAYGSRSERRAALASAVIDLWRDDEHAGALAILAANRDDDLPVVADVVRDEDGDRFRLVACTRYGAPVWFALRTTADGQEDYIDDVYNQEPQW